MDRTLTRVVYLSSTHAGCELFEYLKSLPCEIVLSDTDNQKISNFPSYDLGLSFLYSHRIPESEFAVPYKWVNFHPAPLPELRGRNVAYHAIIKELANFGATIHYMDTAFDTGEIIDVIRFPIEPFHTAGDLVQLAHEHLVSLFKKYVPLLLRNVKIESFRQGKGVYYKKSPISHNIELSQEQKLKVRAITALPRFYATTIIGGKTYKIVPTSE